MKKISIACLVILLAIGLAYTESADRATGARSLDKEALDRQQVSQPSELPPIYQEGKALLNEGFEGTTFPPTGWQVLNLDGGLHTWVRYTFNPYSGTACAAVRWESSTLANNDWLITPPLYPQAGDTIKWWMRSQGTTFNDSIQIWISTTDSLPASFSYVTSFSNATTTYLQRAVPLTPYAGQRIFVAFVYRALDQWRAYIDNVTGPELSPSFNNDLALQSIDVPAGSYMAPNEVFTPRVTVRNTGLLPQATFHVIYNIDDGSKALVYTDTVFVEDPDTLFPNTSRQLFFEDFVPVDLTNYNVTATVVLAGDQYPANDVITRYFRTFNELQGYVSDDNAGGAPVAGATITATGPATYVTTTNSAGNYFFFDMMAGTYTVTATKTGYITETITGVAVIDNMQTILDLSMGYPVLSLTPSDSIYLTLEPDQIDNTTWQFTLVNNGSRDMTYNVIWPEANKSWGVKYIDDMDGANDTVALKARGYKPYYRGTGPQGLTATWYQGQPSVFPAYNGPDNGYVAANYNVVTGANNIDSWLVFPINLYGITAGDSLYFYSRSPDGSIYPDSIRVMYSVSDSVPEGVWTELGRFKVSTAGWERRGFAAPATSANGRFAIRYCVRDGGPQGSNSNYIGIDAISIVGKTNVNWLNISPASGTVPAYDVRDLEVTFNSTGLALGDYAANVTFNTNAALGKARVVVPAYLHVAVTGVSGGTTQPLSYAFGLNANRPNPVRGKTTFSFTLPKAQDYALMVYNVAGQQVATFAGRGQAGPNSVVWDAGKNAPGVYFYQLVSGGMSTTRKLVVVK